MTKLQKCALETLAERLDSLASLENASFSCDHGTDLFVKNAVKSYMGWFECVSHHIRDIVKLDDMYSPIYSKVKCELEEIIRLNS